MSVRDDGLQVPPCPFCGHGWGQQYAQKSIVGAGWMAYATCSGCGCMMWSDEDCRTETAAFNSLAVKLRARARIETE